MSIDVYIGSLPPDEDSFPDATNTGVPAGTTLTTHSGQFNTSADDQVVDALDISGALVIDHTGVLIKNCKITASNEGGGIIVVNATGATIQDCEIDGDMSGSTGLQLKNGIQCYRLNVHGCENGGNVNANSSSDPCRLEDSFIHDLSLEGSGFHTDGLQFDADASYLTIEHCHFQPIPSGERNATSCINLDNEVGATNNNITINNSLIDGGGCASALYVPRHSGWSNLVVTNNRMLPGDNGYTDGGNAATWPDGGVTTFTGNVDDSTGATLDVSD